MSTIEQNDEGTIIGIPYQDNGVFYASFVNTHTGEEIDRVNVSQLFEPD